MSVHHITIAKASFTAACLRPDVTQLSREDVSNFHGLLENAVLRCTPQNVQKCKDWLLVHVAPSPRRISALAKLLASTSKYVGSEEKDATQHGIELDASRKRLHLLYILNDILHHVRHHIPESSSADSLRDSLQPSIIQIFELARSDSKKRTVRKLGILADIWDQEQYFSKATLAQLRGESNSGQDTAKNASITLSASKSFKELPYLMPATHGDPSTPYYDLPAANLMPHIMPNKSVPMRPDQIRALQLSAGPADDNLLNALKGFLKDVNRTSNPYQALEDEGIVADMDELGQFTYRNETDEIVGDTYYGWSRDFCDRMRKRGQQDTDAEKQGRSRVYSRSRSTSRSRSRSLSRSPLKRRRYDSSRSRSRSRDRQRSRGRSRSRSPVLASFVQAQPPTQQTVFSTTSVIPPNIPYPPFPVGVDGLPLPPPRPPNYTGPWPPPPPPPPPSASFGNTYYQPPPPPPSQLHPGNQASRFQR